MGLLDKIKADSQKSGQNKSKFMYFRDGDKKRIRFLQDMEDGWEVAFHDSFEAGVNVPCQEVFGRRCQYCGEEGLRTRSQYAWSVYDYESNEVKILMHPMNNCSPLGSIAAAYENYGTLLDRDYVIGVTGKQQNKQFSVMPMDKNKFRNEKAKPLSKSAFLKILDKAFPDEHADLNDSDDDYEDMSPRELYNLCEDRGIEAEPKMKKDYYINLLKEADNEKEDEDWGDEEESKSEYSDMKPVDLYKLCKERNIEAEPKKPAAYYVNLLEEADKAEEDWGDEEDEDDEDEAWKELKAGENKEEDDDEDWEE